MRFSFVGQSRRFFFSLVNDERIWRFCLLGANSLGRGICTDHLLPHHPLPGNQPTFFLFEISVRKALIFIRASVSLLLLLLGMPQPLQAEFQQETSEREKTLLAPFMAPYPPERCACKTLH